MMNKTVSNVFCNIGRVLTSSLDKEEVYRRVMSIIGEYFSPRNWSLLLKEENTDRLKFEIVMGADADKLKKESIERGEGIVGWVCRKGKPLLVEDAQNDPRFSPRIDRLLGFKTRSVVCVPLLNGNNRVVGAIELINKIVPPSVKSASGSSATGIIPSNKSFTDSDMMILSAIGMFTGIAAENTFLHHKVRELSMKDPLTGIHNRYYLNKALLCETKRVKRYRHTVCMLMIDVDDFKGINDNYGHPTGDKVLCAIADILKSSVRKSDVVARFGGDEFVILMPLAGKIEGMELAERIRKLIRQLNLRKSIPGLRIGVSIGIYAAGIEDVDNILSKADNEMYRCKSFRKNPEKLRSGENMQ